MLTVIKFPESHTECLSLMAALKDIKADEFQIIAIASSSELTQGLRKIQKVIFN